MEKGQRSHCNIETLSLKITQKPIWLQTWSEFGKHNTAWNQIFNLWANDYVQYGFQTCLNFRMALLEMG